MRLKGFFKFSRCRVGFIGLFLLFVVSADAQNLTVNIKTIGETKVSIRGVFAGSQVSFKNFSFIKSYADAENLANRIENFRAFNEKNAALQTKKIIAGEYQTSENPLSFEYEVNLKPSEKITDAAHASWLTKDYGLLMLADLLPELNDDKNNFSVKIKFDLPEDFKIYPPDSVSANTDEFLPKDTKNAVFLVGRAVRERVKESAGKSQTTSIVLSIYGNWQFTDEEAAAMIDGITENYGKLFKQFPQSVLRINIIPFPSENAAAERWRAETRGSTVTIVSGKIPLKSVAIQRLHEQLRHEIFHLWIPNGLNLSGNYDWFYEGFTLYKALRTGVELNQIRFEDFLKTISRAYDISPEFSETKSFSLLDASNKRWVGSEVFIYAKGLSVAFLCDVALLRESKGSRNSDRILAELYEKHRFGNPRTDANQAILKILKSYPELVPIIQKYVEGNDMFAADEYFDAAGLEFEPKTQKNSPSKLIVKAKLNGRQKDLLNKLGYNQWRKLLSNKK